MHKLMPPLNALRAFEAAARHLSLTKAAQELNVTAGALSHQIRGLEELLGLKLFQRGVRAIALTAAGRQLYPGLQTGFIYIRDAVASLSAASNDHVLVISTPPGLTSKWLAPRLFRFSTAHPDIDTRVSSSRTRANFVTDGVDVALRHLSLDAPPDPELEIERLIELHLVPVCSPRLVAGRTVTPESLTRLPLIHDESLMILSGTPTWPDWLRTAGVAGTAVGRGLTFSSADHALDATAEGAGILLTQDLLAYDDLRTGRLIVPVPLALRARSGFHVVCPTRERDRPKVQAFRNWVKQEAAAIDWSELRRDWTISDPKLESLKRE